MPESTSSSNSGGSRISPSSIDQEMSHAKDHLKSGNPSTGGVDQDLDNNPQVDQAFEDARRRKSSIDAPHEGRRFAKPRKQAFLSDDEIASHWFFKLAELAIFSWNNWLHRISYVGNEKLPADSGALLVYIHSTHNIDIPYGIIGTYKATGHVVRGLVHRWVMFCFPVFAYLGMVPGYRDTAVELLKAGHWVGVIPGGGEEAMRGHENQYNLRWPTNRRGFAKVAIKANVPIVPIFYQNLDEMRFNPLFWCWNKIGASKVYQKIVDAKLPVLSPIVKVIGEVTWFTMAWTLLPIPMPCKVTAYVGDPIYPEKDDDTDKLRERTYTAIKALIAKHQPNGKDYPRAYRMWKEDRARGETPLNKKAE